MHILIVFLAVILTTGCSKEIDSVVPYAGEQLVVNGILSPRQTVTVSVSQTAPVIGRIPDDLSLDDAVVTLFQDEQPVEVLSNSTQEMYTSERLSDPGSSYYVRVEHPNFGLTSTNSQPIPSRPQLTEYRYEPEGILPLNDDANAGGLYLSLIDSLPISYYSVNVQGFRNTEEVAINVWQPDQIEDVGNTCGFVGGNDTFDFSKACFTGDTYQAEFGIETTGFLNGEMVECTHLIVSVAKISEDYYRYLETSVQPEGIDLAFVEPQVVFSNVPGGYGLVGAIHVVEATINL